MIEVQGGVHMAQEKKAYPAEFKRRMVELVRAGQSPESLAKEFEPSANTIRKWANQADIDEGLRADGLTTAERNELRELRRENKQLKLEREILGKAAAWFARESITLPKPTDS
jgi:transposase-like protein